MDVDAYCARTTANVGDKFCDPTRYFDLRANINRYDIRDPDVGPGSKVAICGGGGMLVDTIRPCVVNIAEKYLNGTILWGVGLNNGGTMMHMDRWPEWEAKWPSAKLRRTIDAKQKTIKKRAPVLIGCRDWSTDANYRWVPCASCMHQCLDEFRPGEVPIVIYDHYDHAVPVTNDYIRERMGIEEVPRRDNRSDAIEPVIEFLNRGNVIFTTSYHGAYWGMLLGKVVFVFAWSSKFLHMRWGPDVIWPIGEPCDILVGVDRAWYAESERVKAAQRRKNMLISCRQANNVFADDVRMFLRMQQSREEW